MKRLRGVLRKLRTGNKDNTFRDFGPGLIAIDILSDLRGSAAFGKFIPDIPMAIIQKYIEKPKSAQADFTYPIPLEPAMISSFFYNHQGPREVPHGWLVFFSSQVEGDELREKASYLQKAYADDVKKAVHDWFGRYRFYLCDLEENLRNKIGGQAFVIPFFREDGADGWCHKIKGTLDLRLSFDDMEKISRWGAPINMFDWQNKHGCENVDGIDVDWCITSSPRPIFGNRVKLLWSMQVDVDLPAEKIVHAATEFRRLTTDIISLVCSRNLSNHDHRDL